MLWSQLKKGDVVDLVAPGWACSEEELQGGVAYLENLGLRARVPKDLFGVDLLCSNTDKARLRHLKKAFYAKDSKAVWCVRGGYGSLRLMPELLKWTAPTRAKVFIGYSDVTSLHYFLNTCWKWPSLHGPLLDRMGSERAQAQEKNELENILFGKIQQSEFSEIKPLNVGAKQIKSVSGLLVGGNLSVLASAVGTKLSLKSSGKILFFEDWGERAYRLDRMMQQLAQSGSLKGAKAILLGDFLGGSDKDGVSRVWEFWNQFAKSSSIPVFAGLPVGHGNVQRTLALGVRAHISRARAQVTLTLPTGVQKK